MTFREHCILKAALQLFAEQTALPAHIEQQATNGGQFTVEPNGALAVRESLDAAVFADRLIGDLTKTDAEHIATLVSAYVPEQKKDRAAKARQQRFTERTLSLIGK